MQNATSHLFYSFPAFGEKDRTDPCSVCRERHGYLVGRMNYAGLGEWDVVQCPDCGLVGFDPMPGVEVIRQGGERLYSETQSSHSRKRFLRFFSRSYRRGGHFALHYLRRLNLVREAPALLEIGAGNGYFSQGIKAIYPDAGVHYLDIMTDLLSYYRRQFDCEATSEEFSSDIFHGKRFDLIIARDILEHVHDPLKFLKDAHELLNEGGLLFFITPNGRENFWECSQRFKHSKAATLIWQNHFHYFLPETLRRMLNTAGFHEEIAFKWGLKHWRKGLGWAEMQLAPETIPEVPDHRTEEPPSEKWAHDCSEVTSPWLHNHGLMSRIYSSLVDRQRQRVSFSDPRGHEFFLVARKQ